MEIMSVVWSALAGLLAGGLMFALQSFAGQGRLIDRDWATYHDGAEPTFSDGMGAIGNGWAAIVVTAGLVVLAGLGLLFWQDVLVVQWIFAVALIVLMISTASWTGGWASDWWEVSVATALIILEAILSCMVVYNTILQTGWLIIVMLLVPLVALAIMGARITHFFTGTVEFGWAQALIAWAPALVGVVFAIIAGFAMPAMAQTLPAEPTAEVQVVDDTETEEVSEQTTVNTSEFVFCNDALQTDSDPLNNYDFGKPITASTAEGARDELLSRMSKDPALTAATAAWLDANMGTNFMGEFYDSVKGDWSAAINKAIDNWTADPTVFRNVYSSTSAFIRYQCWVKLTHDSGTLHDMMYMLPSVYTSKGHPEVIVMLTNHQKGDVLTIGTYIKPDPGTVTNPLEAPADLNNINPYANAKFAQFRLDCGGQPMDVQQKLHIQPMTAEQVEQVVSSGGTGGAGGTTPSGGGGTPDNPTPTPGPKDPSKSNDSGPNDDPGPGPNNNNPSNPNVSKADTNPTNSGYMSNKTDYDNAIGNVEKANQQQGAVDQTGNNASYTPPTSSNVDNNGGGNINKPSTPPSSGSVTDNRTGQTSNTTQDGTQGHLDLGLGF